MENKRHKRAFKGVYIPAEIWLSPELSAHEKLIFMEINSLDREFGCVAENDHFVEWLGIGERAVQKHIKQLKDKGMISVTLNKAKHKRTMRVIGKYAEITPEQIAEIGFLKKELLGRFKM